ncbi:MAG: exopolysaccharide biosynthesis polyprenyl glycosylphosphotransferase, partial [Endomicrobia bacterium]|nr:exopolysaccharide biosynthesis polyprenyl glycosylphosphotransferase [Endomicrobiia bacterium]
TDLLIDSTLGIPVVWVKPLSLTGVNFLIKRSIDIFISILVLSICFIPLVFISLLIKLDSEGPIFFVHDRVGRNGRVFKCIKFRTMVKEAHKMWWDLLKYSERGEKVFKLKNDPRVTRVGKWLRRFSIDEIPQFFNVLKGEMSIVGPRPQIVEEVSFYDKYAKRRLMILPGLTGLWQISGRADIGFNEMVDLDLYYIENWSLGLDLEILLKTIFVIFSGKGAY